MSGNESESEHERVAKCESERTPAKQSSRERESRREQPGECRRVDSKKSRASPVIKRAERAREKKSRARTRTRVHEHEPATSTNDGCEQRAKRAVSIRSEYTQSTAHTDRQSTHQCRIPARTQQDDAHATQ